MGAPGGRLRCSWVTVHKDRMLPAPVSLCVPLSFPDPLGGIPGHLSVGFETVMEMEEVLEKLPAAVTASLWWPPAHEDGVSRVLCLKLEDVPQTDSCFFIESRG